tara:strand:- start:235 stop:966 length:732 start_codon:yes stop_codon:yes gene_type:complete
MLTKIKEILIIVNPNDQNIFKNLLGNGSRFGINITYKIQNKPTGIPDALAVGKSFIGKSNILLILGDNFFYGDRLPLKILSALKNNSGATIFTHPVLEPNQFGIVEKNKKSIMLKEKPIKTKSNSAITGLYVLNNDSINYIKLLKPSKRNETEIIDLLKIYLKKKKLKIEEFGRGTAWLDAGTFENFTNASNFIYNVEKRQGFKIACLEEIAFNNKWINKIQITKAIKFYGNCDYSRYLKKII